MNSILIFSVTFNMFFRGRVLNTLTALKGKGTVEKVGNGLGARWRLAVGFVPAHCPAGRPKPPSSTG